MKLIFVIFILNIFTLHAVFSHEDVPLKGIVLLGPDEMLLDQEDLNDLEGVHFIGLDVPDQETISKNLAEILYEKSLTQTSISEIKQTIIQFFTKNHKPFVLTHVPEQEVSQGVIQMIIQESCVGKICIQGDRWSSQKRLISYLNLQEGGPIDELKVFNALYFMNQNLFRRVDVIYSPGEAKGTTDVTLAVEDRLPIRIYAGSDNTGVEPTERERWFVGFNWANAFGLEHVLSYQYTAAYNISRFQAHTGQYTLFFPWKHILNIYGGYNEVEPKISMPIMKNTGWGMQTSLRYEIPLFIRQFLEQQVNFGFDFKRTNNTFTFTDDSSNFGQLVNLSQLVFGYKGDYERDTYRLDFEGNLYYSPGRIFSDQTDTDYQTLRAGADNDWVYFRGSFVYLQKMLDGFSLLLSAEGQGSSATLLPSEQFGLGGYSSVRGYDERAVNKDNAILLSMEGRTPAVGVISYFSRNCCDALQLLGFIDYGWGIDNTINPPSAKSEYLLGIGPGIRYTWNPYITARLDWGIKMKKNSAIGKSFSKIHFGAVISY